MYRLIPRMVKWGKAWKGHTTSTSSLEGEDKMRLLIKTRYSRTSMIYKLKINAK